MTLEREYQTYQRALPELSSQEGKYVLIHGLDVIDTFGAYEDALKQGYERFGVTPFLVKQVRSVEPVKFFTRDIRPLCRT